MLPTGERFTLSELSQRDDKTQNIFLKSGVVQLINKNMQPGYQSIVWNGRNNMDTKVSAGIYFYHIRANNFIKTRKMVLLK